MKKVVILVVVAFVGFYLFTDPNGLAHLAKSGTTAGLHGVGQVFGVMKTFLNSLLS